MQRTIWEWLGIEKTTDKSRIKKAYAKQAKKYHPEEFPEEAMALRKAYKDALAQASAFTTVSEWADDDFVQEPPLAVKNPECVLKELPHSDSQPESDPGAGSGYVYTKSVPSLLHSETGAGAELRYIYAKPASTPERTERIDSLKSRLEVIYGSGNCNVSKEWKRAFATCLEPEDMKDIRAVWEVFNTIKSMSRLEGFIWELLQTELFRFQENTASWQQLQERFDAVRRPYKAPEETPAAASPKKASSRDIFLATLIVFLVIGLPIGIMDKVQEWKQQQRMQEEFLKYQQMVREQIQWDAPTIPISRETLQKLYTKTSPCEMDLNQDGTPDHIYYDSDEALFLVELYDAAADAYIVRGSVDQYLEENPETEYQKFLSYFTDNGNAR